MSETTLILPAWTCGPGHVVTARSYMIDRFDPAPELISLPPRTTGGGELRFGIAPMRAAPPEVAGGSRHPGRHLRRWLRARTDHPMPGPFLDLRAHAPGNWAHFLNNHLPFLAFLCDRLDLAPSEVTLVLPETTPGHIRKAAALFGVTCLYSAATVTGQGIGFSLRGCVPGQASGWTVFRAIRPEWAAAPWLRARRDAAMAAAQKAATTPLPRRIFLARRDSRVLTNQTEIAALLAPQGHVTVYPEDLSPADQFRLFEEAEEIVAVHGAGLAPLLYRSPAAPPCRLVEIMPVGHMTDVYRMMAGQMGLGWVGVRGRLRPEHVAPAYDLTRPFTRFSLESFSADPVSIELALDMVRAG